MARGSYIHYNVCTDVTQVMLQSPALQNISQEERTKWFRCSHSRLLTTLCAANRVHEAIDMLLASEPGALGPITYSQVLKRLDYRNRTDFVDDTLVVVYVLDDGFKAPPPRAPQQHTKSMPKQ